jgi:hypothetical protein
MIRKSLQSEMILLFVSRKEHEIKKGYLMKNSFHRRKKKVSNLKRPRDSYRIQEKIFFSYSTCT